MKWAVLGLLIASVAGASERNPAAGAVVYACKLAGAEQMRLRSAADGSAFELSLLAEGKVVAHLGEQDISQASAVVKGCGDIHLRADEGKVRCAGTRIRWSFHMAHADTELTLRYEKGRLEVTSCEATAAGRSE